jgi:hypothetical protein
VNQNKRPNYDDGVQLRSLNLGQPLKIHRAVIPAQGKSIAFALRGNDEVY